MKLFFYITVLSLFVYCNGFPNNELKKSFLQQLKNVPQRFTVIELSIPLSLNKTEGKIDFSAKFGTLDVNGQMNAKATVEATADFQIERDDGDVIDSKIMQINIYLTKAHVDEVKVTGVADIFKDLIESVVKNMANDNKDIIFEKAHEMIAKYVKPYEGKTIREIMSLEM